MIKTMMLSIAILFFNLINAQDKPNVFMTASEFLQGNPSKYCDFILKQRSLGTIFMLGGIDAQIWVCCRTCFVILTDGSVKLLSPELLMKLITDNSELLKQLQASKLKQENVYDMFDFLYRYNQSKK